MPLRLHRAVRADLLADGLADVLRTPRADPFAPELVLVPARGVERWLSQRLSHVLGAGVGGDGVCAGVELRSPRSLAADLTRGGETDPWAPDRMVWSVLSVLDASTGQPWCATLDRHLGRGPVGPGQSEDADLRHGRRYSVAHRLARLFAAYASQRPAVLADWEAGRDTDGVGGPVDPDLAWQPELWRRVVAEVGEPSPGRRDAAALAAVVADPAGVDLPDRLSLFGHTRLAATDVALLGALAEHRDVDVWLPHPSDVLWQALRDLGGPVPRSEDRSHARVGHPLLATLGRDVRELQRSLHGVVTTSTVLGHEGPPPATLLDRLRHDLAADRVGEPWDLAATDRSVQVHACHGPTRQVEVLREVVLGLLADDPTLEPRDVVVMCPDIESYAPLIEAAFGLGGVAAAESWHPGHRLQVRLADRSLTQTNPLLDVARRLLDLAGGRVEASAVLDLAATDPVRRRFGFTDDDLERLGTWVTEAGIRWAFDAAHREPYGLDDYVQNTWRFGLDRLLAGVAVSDDAGTWFGTTLPLDDVGSTSIDLAGRLAELMDRLQRACSALSGAHPADHWLTALRDGLAALTAVGHGDEWMTGQVQRELVDLPGGVGLRDGVELRLPDVRALLAERLGGRPTRANFRTGSMTICTMVPMRSVPHRVVCLLGLDDGSFPRSPTPDGDDLLARRPVTGERDARSEDRQLLLDAVLAATEHLVVTYSGADETTGARRPPAVPLGELLDAIELTAPGARDRVVVRHPLQAFDERNLRADRPFSFDRAALAGAVAARGDRVAVPGLRGLTLPAPEPADVDLADLGAFLRHPVRELLRRRLEVRLPDDGEQVADRVPVELDGLEAWSVGERLLADQRRGRTPAEALDLEWRRGVLPPGRLGWRAAQRLSAAATPVAELAAAVVDGRTASSADVDVDLGGGRRLRGTVTNLYGDRLVTVGYSRIGPRHHLDAWVPLLALCATWPDGGWSAGAVGRGGRDAPAARIVFGHVDGAAALLADLVALYDAGMTAPLPLPLKTGHALVTRGRSGAEAAWSRDRFAPENADPLHVAVWGPDAGLDVLEPGLADLAARLWRPILERRI